MFLVCTYLLNCGLVTTGYWESGHTHLHSSDAWGNKKGAENWDLQRDLRPKSEIAKVKKSNFYCFLATNEP